MSRYAIKQTIEKLLVTAIFLFLLMPVLTQAAQYSGTDDEKKAPALSSIETYKKAGTSQKTYKYGTSGVNKDSSTTEYSQTVSHGMYEDKDLDGRFGEKEAAKTDTDHDGRKGEREAQLGTESVTQSQKITVLNNMGAGNSLSTFKASGQTDRPTIVDEPQKTAHTESVPVAEAPVKKADKPSAQPRSCTGCSSPKDLVAF